MSTLALASGAGAPGGVPQAGVATRGSGLILALFFLTFFIPYGGEVLGMSVYPLRALILVLFVPVVAKLITRQAGRWTGPDTLIAAFAAWIVITLLYHHGAARLPYGAVLAIEVFGGYALGRLLIRSTIDYRRFIRFYLIALALLIPLALAEFLNPAPGAMVRWGFARVQLNFPHEILYGLFCSMAVANSYYLYRDRKLALLPALGVALFTTALSLSSAPLLAMVLQLGMILWDRIMRGRWLLFAGLALAAYLFLEMFTTRGTVVFLINKVTFTPQTGYMRLHIWTWGKAAVLENPIFGIGLNDWARPVWLTPSVDNFWLLTAMRHGLPGVGLLLGALALHIWLILRARGLDPQRQTIRVAYLVTLLGTMFILCTVHVWNELLIFVMFYIGAGAFLYTSAPEGTEAAPGSPAPQRRALPQTRFGPLSHLPAGQTLKVLPR